MAEYLIPLETSETKSVVVAVEFPLLLKERTAGVVVEHLDPLKEEEAAAVGDHLGVEEEKKKDPIWV